MSQSSNDTESKTLFFYLEETQLGQELACQSYQRILPNPNLTCESDSDISESIWSDEDEDRFCGDPEWEFSLAAVAWEARRKLYAEAMIKKGEEEAALVHIRFLFEEEEEEEPCVTCKPNWDWDRYDSDDSYGTDSATDSDES